MLDFLNYVSRFSFSFWHIFLLYCFPEISEIQEYILGHVPSLKAIRTGTAGGKWSRGHGRILLTGLLVSVFTQPSFLCDPGPLVKSRHPWVGIHQQYISFYKSASNLQNTVQIWWRHILSPLRLFSPNMSSFVWSWQNSTRTKSKFNKGVEKNGFLNSLWVGLKNSTVTMAIISLCEN